jgi:3-deoxy-7-phosphoheptulonate synthase
MRPRSSTELTGASSAVASGLPADHQPAWATPEALPGVLAELRGRHPLVEADACHALLSELRLVAAGRQFVLQGGDCAEPFADAFGRRTQAKAYQLAQLADTFEGLTDTPVVRIGRFAGQYAKPRSSPYENLPDGTVIPVFRGEAVNGPAPTRAARRADVRRLLAAYDHAAAALDSLFFNRFLPVVGDGGQTIYAPAYVSHEALLLDYERALLRPDQRGGRYASSAHLVWIGERTRRLDGAHLDFAESINNPVGVKVGPGATAVEIAGVIGRLAGEPGRLSLIVRMGARAIGDRFPALLDALGDRARRAVWLSDPMHGNTRRSATGQKTRVLTEMLAEVDGFFAALTARGLHPGGLHLELTPDPVTECVADLAALAEPTSLLRYESTCDPRLDHAQADAVVRSAAAAFAAIPARRPS